MRRVLFLCSGPLLASLLAPLLASAGHTQSVVVTGAVVVWCAAWWVLEPIPIAVTSMIPIPNGKGEALLTWDDAVRIPWGILLLCAGGFAIADAFRTSGISLMIGNQLAGLSELTPWLVVAVVCLAVTFLTEVTSNTATSNLLLPILALVPLDDPKRVMIPATISASFAFMMPAATFPNAIVFAGGRIRVSQMVREGVVLNLVGVVIVTVLCFLLL